MGVHRSWASFRKRGEAADKKVGVAMTMRHPELQLLYLRRDLADAFGEEVLTAARVGGLLARGRTQEEIAEELHLGPDKIRAALRLLRNAAAEAA
jgi:hypothetical protein